MDKFIDTSEHVFIHPFSNIIAGGSQSGKTTFTFNLIKNLDQLIQPKIDTIIFFYKEYQKLYDQIKDIEKRAIFINGFDMSMVDKNLNSLVIIDDQMSESMKDKDIQELFTSGIHHNSISVCFLTQNLYSQGKYARDIRLSTHYFTIMKTVTFNSQIQILGRQLFPDSPNFLYKSYKLATETPYSYIVISCHPKSEDLLRVQSGIFPNENHIVYLPK